MTSNIQNGGQNGDQNDAKLCIVEVLELKQLNWRLIPSFTMQQLCKYNCLNNAFLMLHKGMTIVIQDGDQNGG